MAALALTLVAGCSQVEETAAVPETTETPAAKADPTPADLAVLTLTVADLPTGGWTLAQSGVGIGSQGAETSTGKAPGDICGLDFASVFAPDSSDDVNGNIFTRASLDQQLNTGVFIVEDGEQVVADLNTGLDSCSGPFTSTRDGQETRVQIDELAGGEAAIEGDSKACRQVEMTFGYTSIDGSFCFVADGDLVVSTMTTSTSTSTVQPDEFAQLSNTATQKAFASR
jgi:hypothetical protein